MSAPQKAKPSAFYGQWKGHPISDLTAHHSAIRSERPGKPIVYLAGDSSLDNKAWIPSAGPGGEPLPVDTPVIYESLLDPPRPKPDVAFWLNHFLKDKATVINAAVEESMLRERDTELLPHDEFIRDHIRSEDILIVSIGANDIALRPNASTARHMFQLAWLTMRRSIDNGTAGSLTYFRHMFGDQVQSYISRLTEKQKPRVVIPCMIYYPLESGVGDQSSWADTQLKVLGYGSSPGQLQAAIKKIYEQATSNIKIEGTTIVPCALFEAMDGKNKEDYVARVEPSVEGGRKMGAHLKSILDAILGT